MFPVDLLPVDHTDLTSASQKYLSSLESRPGAEEWFQSSTSSKVPVTPQNIAHLQLFDQPECFLLALHLSDDPTQVVAVYLPDRWWAVDDVLRTSNASRSGLQSVESLMERVLVFLLSQVVDRPLQEEVHFSPHPPTETCKLLWREGEAVGFYSVKHKGSLCDGWSSRCYQLTVLDSVLVRRRCRRTGLGLHILDHFCSSFFSEDVLGLSAPLSASMVSVCRRFLQKHKEHRERLYEVEAPGGWAQRRNIWINIQLGRYAHGMSLTSVETEQKEEGDSSQQVKPPAAPPAPAAPAAPPAPPASPAPPAPAAPAASPAPPAPPAPPPTQQQPNLQVLTGSDDAHHPNNYIINSDQQFKVCDRSPDGGSLSSRLCGTGCRAPAHADDLDCGPSTTAPAKSHNTKRRGIKRVHSTEDTAHSVHKRL